MKKTTLLLSLLLIPFETLTEPLTITKSQEFTNGEMKAIIAMSEYAVGFNMGIAFSCSQGNPEIILQFGGFPGVHHPVHLYVQQENKTTVFSDTVRGSPQAGFHSPKITLPDKINQFLSLVFEPANLITNGYRGFYLALPDRGQSATALINNC